TTLSFLLSVVGSWAAILVASEIRGRFSLIRGCALMALGIASMHLTGMQAIEMKWRAQIARTKVIDEARRRLSPFNWKKAWKAALDN
ncbi:hypothetical protein ACC709_36505, partial [Rhizobium ruizarguesonis]